MHLLPYRADPAELRRYLLALARGRTREQLREHEFSTKTLDGVASAAEAFGLTAGENGSLSGLGRRFATATGDAAREVTAEIVESYPPYRRLAGAARRTGDATTLEWVQEWWAENGIGTSDSNRTEAAPVFARFVEAAGLGRFVQGRKGRQSRIEWSDAVVSGVENAKQTAERAAPAAPQGAPAAPAAPNRVSWELGPGRRMTLELPAGLSDEERLFAFRLIAVLLRRECV